MPKGIVTMLHKGAGCAGLAITILVGAVFPDGARAGTTFTDVTPQEIRDAEPGSILRVRPIEGGGLYQAKVYRVLFRSTGPKGEPTTISSAILIPDKPASRGGRPVVAWAHQTTGVMDRCSPTRRLDVPRTIPGLWDMISRGYIVTAPDYGNPGPPLVQPFLIGEAEAHAVLDSVRAARQLPDADAQNRFAVWGHSQGGHAALFTGQLAAGYAPELELVGVAAAAPATYLERLFDSDRHTLTGRALTSMALLSWSDIFKIPLDSILAPDARDRFEQVAHDCIETITEFIKISAEEVALEDEKLLTANPTKVEPWASIMQRNSPGQAPAGAPVFIAQGTADSIVAPQITKEFVEDLCSRGTSVKLMVIEGAGHDFAARDSALKAVAWMADRFRSRPTPNDCKNRATALHPQDKND